MSSLIVLPPAMPTPMLRILARHKKILTLPTHLSNSLALGSPSWIQSWNPCRSNSFSYLSRSVHVTTCIEPRLGLRQLTLPTVRSAHLAFGSRRLVDTLSIERTQGTSDAQRRSYARGAVALEAEDASGIRQRYGLNRSSRSNIHKRERVRSRGQNRWSSEVESLRTEDQSKQNRDEVKLANKGRLQWSSSEMQTFEKRESQNPAPEVASRQNPSVDTSTRERWRKKLEDFKGRPIYEIVFTEKEARRHVELIKEVAQSLGLYSKLYDKILVVSKELLPHYRPDLDAKRPQRKITVPEDFRRRTDKVLQEIIKLRQVAALGPSSYPSLEALSECEDSEADEGDELSSGEDVMVAAEPGNSHAELYQQRKSERLQKRQDMWRESAGGRKFYELRSKLPAFSKREALLQAMANNQVLVVTGETGCGKTTQLPQFILEDEISRGRGGMCNIICTQPRRISAMSVAERVASERGEELGESVGYQVRLEGKRSRRTQLLFCTTGILLRRLSRDPLLSGVSHVLVDEIHERGMNEDFLLIVLKDLLPKRPDLRLVLMSATLNAELFSNFFASAPMMHIPGFTHPVRHHFLEDILEMTGHTLTPYNQIDDYGADKQWKQHRQMQSFTKGRRTAITNLAYDAMETVDYKNLRWNVRESLACWNGEALNFNLIERVLSHIVEGEPDGSVLVFLTGWEDITAMLGKLQGHPILGDRSRVLLLGCHGSMGSEEQKLIFNPAPEGVRKIVLATNMAETSITINDCVYVVDTGKAKETSYDALNNIPCLLPSWISQASARQRRGRAGRVRPGVCFHLYPKVVHDALAEYSQPHLLRTPLHSLCLQIKALQLGNIADFLGKALQPPEPLAVEKAIELLFSIGALDQDENLTALGKHLIELPLEPGVGKMLLLGAAMRCVGPILTVAAAQAQRDPWLSPVDKKQLADERRFAFAASDRSDHMALVRAYEQWADAREKGMAHEFCHENFLSNTTMHSISSLRRQFLGNLVAMGLVDLEAGPAMANQNSHNKDLVRAIILAGMYPGVASAVPRARSTVFKTREDGQVNIHPSSIVSTEANFPYPWLTFFDKVKTTSVFIKDGTGATDAALLLFGGKLTPGDEPGYLHMPGRYFEFFLPPDAARTVYQLRTELDRLLQEKMEDPTVDMFEKGKGVMDAVTELLQSRNVEGQFIFGHVPRTTQKRMVSAADVAGSGDPDYKSSVANKCKKFIMGRPKYSVEQTGEHVQGVKLHLGRVTVRGRVFQGAPATCKKQAEKNAAKVAWVWLKDVTREQVKEENANWWLRKDEVKQEPVWTAATAPNAIHPRSAGQAPPRPPRYSPPKQSRIAKAPTQKSKTPELVPVSKAEGRERGEDGEDEYEWFERMMASRGGAKKGLVTKRKPPQSSPDRVNGLARGMMLQSSRNATRR